MKREIGDYLEDIVNNISQAMNFVEDMSYEKFIEDGKTIYATTRALEIIGEATKNIPAEIRERYPQIPWENMAGLRDKIIHEYHDVILDVIWKAIKEEIPPLKPQIEAIIKELEKKK